MSTRLGHKDTAVTRSESSDAPSFALFFGRPIRGSVGLLLRPLPDFKPYASRIFPQPAFNNKGCSAHVNICRSVRYLTLLAVLLAGCSNVKPLVIATHVSDPSDGGVSDTTTDFIGAGLTAQFGDVSIDAALGRKAINCAAFQDCPSRLGGMATIRWSPQR